MRCPHCGEETFPKKKNIMSGWTIAKVVEVCAFCNKELSVPSSESGQNSVSSAADDAKKNRLASLLGESVPEKIHLAGKDDRRFCCKCRNFIEHPFKSICALTDLECDPMGECDKFTSREDD